MTDIQREHLNTNIDVSRTTSRCYIVINYNFEMFTSHMLSFFFPTFQTFISIIDNNLQAFVARREQLSQLEKVNGADRDKNSE